MSNVMSENGYPPASFGLDASVQSQFLSFSPFSHRGVAWNVLPAFQTPGVETGRAHLPHSTRVSADFKRDEAQKSENSSTRENFQRKKRDSEAELQGKLPSSSHPSMTSPEHSLLSSFSNDQAKDDEQLEECEENREEESRGITPSSSMEWFQHHQDENSEDEENFFSQSQENFCAQMLAHLKVFSFSVHGNLSNHSSPASSEEISEDSEGNQSSSEEFEGENSKFNFFQGEKESAIRKSNKMLKAKLKQKRCSGACSEHKRRHQRCPMECPNRKRDELLASLAKNQLQNSVQSSST